MATWRNALQGLQQGLQQGLRQPQRFQEPYYRFQSVAEVQQAAQMGIYIDANQAKVDDWLRLPGLSIHQARSLEALSQSGVQFHALDDLAAALNVPVQRLQGLQPILKFCYYDPASPCEPTKLNVNTASVEQLTKIPDLDLFLARKILEQRQQRRFQHIADLQQRLGLPATLVSQLMHYFTF